MARLGWGSGQFKWSAGSPQKQNLQLSCSLIEPPPPQTGTYAKPSIFDCRHNPGPSVASTPKAKGSAARENRSSVAMETVCSHLQLYNPPPLSSSPSNPFQISAPPPTRSGGWFRKGGGGGGGGEREKKRKLTFGTKTEKVKKEKIVKRVWFHSDNCPFLSVFIIAMTKWWNSTPDFVVTLPCCP